MIPSLNYNNLKSFQQALDTDRNFYLVFKVGTAKDKDLNQIVNLCLQNNNCNGIALKINQKRFVFEKHFFLVNLIEKLLFAGKHVGLWGLPHCISRKLLGGYLYMRFFYNQIIEKPSDSVQSYPFKTNASLCETCLDHDRCNGPGYIDIEGLHPIIKKLLPTEPQDSFHPFNKKLSFLNKMHDACLKHCLTKRSPVSYRTIYYVENLDFNSQHSFPNRFVYSCYFPGPDEYEEEFNFLRNHVIHKHHVDFLESVTDIHKTSQIAYSLAQKGDTFRESFYMFTTKQHGERILNDFQIFYNYPKSRQLQAIGVGIDVIYNEIISYKLYFRVNKSFLQQYLKPFSVDLSGISKNLHYLDLRLNQNQSFVSYKIEILFRREELECFKNILNDYKYYKKKLRDSGLYNLAIEISEDKIEKINIYHRHKPYELKQEKAYAF